ncbi:MAG TPA: FG-GAP-like repeat-containing protein [Thermoanaerobaculia bacterium]|nr:FG-GAP-like repeat-containing protein [Thermoanaerobaculia bacterium]
MKATVFIVVGALLLAGGAEATTFVVPEDDELIAKSRAIVIGTVEGSYVQETDGTIETVYEIRLERAMKGLFRGPEVLSVVSLGGKMDDRILYVPASPHFVQGERVLLFLARDHRNRWQTTDMTLGKFRFATSTRGDRMLVREMEDVIGWDRHGQVHREKVRREEGFLRFIDERIHKREAAADYVVEASEVTFPPDDERRVVPNAPFAGATYTSWVSSQPTRWSNMAAGVTFHKRSDQNIPGTADGGVSVIQNALAAWTNECGSVINLSYGGQTPTPSTNFDSVHVVEFNDPQSRISGSWTGSGTIGICFLSFSSQHNFAGQAWWSISDADVVFQNGYPGNHASFPTAMTHELGHGLGWRHSNQDYATGGACNPTTQECTSAAVMNSTVNSNLGYALQPWDVNAAQSVYPGGSCTPVCTAPLITTQPQSQSTTSGTSRTLSVTATGTGPFTYQWYVGNSGNTANPVPGSNGSTLTVTPSSTTSYWVRVSNACGSANSNTATVTVTTTGAGSRVRNDINGDGRADLFWRNGTTGETAIWFMNGTNTPGMIQTTTVTTAWTAGPIGDFDGDRRADIWWYNPSTGETSAWLGWNGSSFPTRVRSNSVPPAWTPRGAIDFNGDGMSDLFWRNNSTGETLIWFMNGALPGGTAVTPTVQMPWTPGPFGDFDGDGRGDVFWRNASTGQTSLWLDWNGSTFATRVLGPAVAAPWTPVLSGDIDGNTKGDVFWFNPSTLETSIWFMNGTSVASAVRSTTVQPHWVPAAAGDYDGGGTTDLFWRNTSNGQTSLWMGWNGTRFTTQVLSITTDSPRWAPVASP